MGHLTCRRNLMCHIRICSEVEVLSFLSTGCGLKPPHFSLPSCDQWKRFLGGSVYEKVCITNYFEIIIILSNAACEKQF